MNLAHPMHLAPRCSATSKRSMQPCRAPAVRGQRVCHFHGARGGAPKGRANGAYRTGNQTHEAKELRRAVARLRQEAHTLLRKI